MSLNLHLLRMFATVVRCGSFSKAADILTGKADPAGRLPFTWPARLADNVVDLRP